MSNRNKIFKRLFSVTIGLALLVSVSSAVKAITRMPEFSLPEAVDGKTVKSADFKGKTLLVTFFATWCGPCRQEIPSLIQIHDEFKSRGFSVVALSLDEGGPDLVRQLVKQENINYPVLMSDRATAGNFGGIDGIPASFLINKNGNVVKQYLGYVPHNLLENDIKTIL